MNNASTLSIENFAEFVKQLPPQPDFETEVARHEVTVKTGLAKMIVTYTGNNRWDAWKVDKHKVTVKMRSTDWSRTNFYVATMAPGTLVARWKELHQKLQGFAATKAKAVASYDARITFQCALEAALEPLNDEAKREPFRWDVTTEPVHTGQLGVLTCHYYTAGSDFRVQVTKVPTPEQVTDLHRRAMEFRRVIDAIQEPLP